MPCTAHHASLCTRDELIRSFCRIVATITRSLTEGVTILDRLCWRRRWCLAIGWDLRLQSLQRLVVHGAACLTLGQVRVALYHLSEEITIACLGILHGTCRGHTMLELRNEHLLSPMEQILVGAWSGRGRGRDVGRARQLRLLIQRLHQLVVPGAAGLTAIVQGDHLGEEGTIACLDLILVIIRGARRSQALVPFGIDPLSLIVAQLSVWTCIGAAAVRAQPLLDRMLHQEDVE